MTTLTPADLHYVLSRTPKDIRALMTANKLFLGGGFIREVVAGNAPKDIDLFGPDKQMLRTTAAALGTERAGRAFFTDNAITVLAPPRLPVQFISRWLYDKAEDVMASFDFTVCQAVIWFENQAWHSLVSDSFYSDLAARRLTYTFPMRDEEAGGSMMRVRKFLGRGYNIQAASLAGVIARVAGGVNGWALLDERGRARVIGGLLQEVDPLSVIDGVDFVDPNAVEQNSF